MATVSHSVDWALGRRSAFAAAALTLGVFSFVNLLGLEKPILAIVFGALALWGGASAGIRGRGMAGLILGGLCIALAAVLAVVFWGDIVAFVRYLDQYPGRKVALLSNAFRGA